MIDKVGILLFAVLLVTCGCIVMSTLDPPSGIVLIAIGIVLMIGIIFERRN